MNSIIDEIKNSFKRGGILIQLIYINLAVFLVIKLLFVLLFLGNIQDLNQVIVNILAVPASVQELMFKPWTLFTYMFLHLDFFHILFNLLWLYWFGQIFLRYLTPRQLLTNYLMGGLAGAFLYILVFNLLPVFQGAVPVSQALGASAAVMAIAIAIAAYAPEHTMHLMFIGPVKLKWLAVVFVVTDILQIASSNAGGHIAHLGGALFGYLYVSQLKKGKDITKGFNKAMDGVATVFKPRKNMHVTYRKASATKEDDWDYNKRKVSEQEEIDAILDKIAKSGYESLSKREKEILFKAGDKS
jgi:membrane associated rhomboid family serine protease